MILLLLKLTALLSVATGFYLAARRASAAWRHSLCVVTLALICIAPFCKVNVPVHGGFVFRTIATSGAMLDGNARTGLSYLPIIWLAGAIVVAARFLLGVVYLSLKSRSAQSGEWRESGIRVRFANVGTPMVWGWIQPLILLPEEAVTWPREQREMAIAHELTHLRRGDNWISLLAAGASAAYWFHPLVWFLSRRLLIEQELICDENVLASGISATGYAELLVEVSRNLSSPALFGCAMFSNRNQLRGRIVKILAYRKKSALSKSGRLGFALAVTVLMSMSFIAPITARTAAVADKPAGNGVYKIGGDVTAPTVLHKVEPQYTKAAAKKKIMGMTLLSLVIDADGQPQDIRVLRSLDPGLDQKAIEAVRQWTFEPGTKDGQPVAVKATIEVNFKLK
ncbi:MAG TPA: M56 family metallopeptidase [Bryobacteraceae bacterium]|nr:M56 family metallopeptidase [Bryobacteraceae bacterium]